MAPARSSSGRGSTMRRTAPAACMLCAVAGPTASAAPPSVELPSFLFILGDDIGWGDMGYSGGTAHTPHIDAFAEREGSIKMMDFHSGGTVCSPTRASLLTGRTPYRDCVYGVYPCSDMTEYTPDFVFAPQRTFTIADAARLASSDYMSMHFGKWHLGSFYNDSEKTGGVFSSPVFHGFDDFNSTVGVAPTATTNCGCEPEWEQRCAPGHYDTLEGLCHYPKPMHGQPVDPHPAGTPGCCYNYWWRNESAPHAVTNLSNPVPDDDSAYVTEAFTHFLERRAAVRKSFVAQIAYHNCHIPFIGTAAKRAACSAGETCDTKQVLGEAPVGGNNYSDTQLDYYACLSELDDSVVATDNGPEVNCAPDGFCSPDHFLVGSGSAGPLRGRKRDTWEGGHRVPGVIAWPAVIKGSNKESWSTAITSDFLPTMLEVLNVERPPSQRQWAMDGVSLLPLMRGEKSPARCIGHLFADGEHRGYRCGKWKIVNGTTSCTAADCSSGPMLYDLESDLGERHDLAKQQPAVLASMIANLTVWWDSIQESIVHESKCPTNPTLQ